MLKPHNTFDINQVDDAWVAVSHNFPDITASGATPQEAVSNLSRAVQYYMDNNKTEYLAKVQARIKKGLVCECGELLAGKPLRVWKAK